MAANMKANKLDPAQVPVLIQYNKQDVPDAMTPDEMEQAYGVRTGKGFPAVATLGDGVMETFLAATKVMLRRLVEKAEGKTREAIDSESLSYQVDRVFEPYMARIDAVKSLPSMPSTACSGRSETLIVEEDHLSQQAVLTGLTLGEKLSLEKQRSARLERESMTFRQLGEVLRQTGATFDHKGIIDRTLSMISGVVGAAVISLARGDKAGGRTVGVDQVWGAERDPLSDSIPGHRLLHRVVTGKAPLILNDLKDEGGETVPEEVRNRFRAIAGFPVDTARGTALVVYSPGPDGRFDEDDVRFLSTAAAHLAVGLEKVQLYRQLSDTRDRLELLVRERTEALRRAYEEIRSRERMKDRFLSNLSHEMRTPLTTMTGAATFLGDYESKPEARREMADAILEACSLLNGHLEKMFRAVQLQTSGDVLDPCDTDPAYLASEAADLAGMPDLSVEIENDLEPFHADRKRVSRAIANLLDNARKFGKGDHRVVLRMQRCSRPVPAVVISVLDRNETIPPEDRERIFLPFEQVGDTLTGKPDGVGLGLYESRGIAELHCGSLLYREREGGGNEFRMILPRATAMRESTEVAGA
jgi:signal transduction histidine kinase